MASEIFIDNEEEEQLALFTPKSSSEFPTSESQLEAINHDDGPCIVLAAPGSGKTWIITKRYSRLVNEKKLGPQQILALTYNKKAAEEMATRVLSEIGPVGGNPMIMTYNAFAVHLVQQCGRVRGWHNYRIVEPSEQEQQIKKLLDELRPPYLYNPGKPFETVREVQQLIQRMKQELLTPAAYKRYLYKALAKAEGLEELELQRQLEVANIYERLHNYYKKNQIMDHDDAILRALELVRTEPSARKYASSFKYIMVDEYQDTNTAQAIFVKELASNNNILVVADDDQAIYRFRGASRANIRKFKEDFPDYKQIFLLENRRSTPEIVALSQAIIDKSVSREDKKVVAIKGSGEKPQLWHLADSTDEAIQIANRIGLLIQRGVPAQEIAVLLHYRKDIDPIAAALREAGIPYIAVGGVGFFLAPEIKNALGFFKTICSPTYEQGMLRCFQLPGWRISDKGRKELLLERNKRKVSLLEIIKSPEKLEFLSAEDKSNLTKLHERISELHELSLSEEAIEVFWKAIRETGYYGVTAKMRSLERQQVGANLNKLMDIFTRLAENAKITSFNEVVEHLKIMQDAGIESVAPLSAEAKGVQLSTIHGAKGREWDHVFVAGCQDGRFPSKPHFGGLELPANFNPEGIGSELANQRDEELRLFYVAITRARKGLVVSYADRYSGDREMGGQIEDLPTSFMKDLPAGLFSIHSKANEPSLFAPPKIRKLPAELRGAPKMVSYSLLSTLRECPRRYEYKYIWDLPEEKNLVSHRGTLIHETLQKLVNTKISGEEVTKKAATTLWKQACEGPNGLLEDKEGGGWGKELITRYLESPGFSEGKPEEVEKEFFVPFRDTVVHGFFDRIDKRDGRIVIIDYKTGRPGSLDAEKLRTNQQLKAYAVMASKIYKVEEVDCEIHWLQNGTIGKTTFNKLQIGRAAYGLTKQIEKMEQRYDRGFFPAIATAYNCRGCAYRDICDEGRGLN